MHGLERRRPTPSTSAPPPIGRRGFHLDHHTAVRERILKPVELENVAACNRDVNYLSSSGLSAVCHGMVAIAGRRRRMENAVSVVPAFLTVHFNDVYHFFGVYNGYGGSEAAEFCKNKLYQVVTEEIKACVESSAGGGILGLGSCEWKKVMSRSFSKVSTEITDCVDCLKRSPVGSTAAVVVVNLNQIVIANSGDSQAVLWRDGKAIRLNSVAKKHLQSGDVNRSVVIPQPAVDCFQRSEEDEFLILASRGLWNVVETVGACEIVRMCLNRVNQPSTESNSDFAAAFLVKLAFSRGSSDNISVVVVDFKLKT